MIILPETSAAETYFVARTFIVPLDARGGSVFRNLLGAAEAALIRAAASTQTLCRF